MSFSQLQCHSRKARLRGCNANKYGETPSLSQFYLKNRCCENVLGWVPVQESRFFWEIPWFPWTVECFCEPDLDHWRKTKSILESRHICHLCIYPLLVPAPSPLSMLLLASLTPATHCFLPEHWAQHQPTPITWKGSVSSVWHAHVSDPYSVIWKIFILNKYTIF